MNYSKSNKNYNFKNNTNLKPVDNYYSSKNDRYLQISLENRNKKKKIKPPFKQGLYSYKQSFNTLQSGYNKKNLSNNFYSDNSPNYSNFRHKKENTLLNINNNIQPWGGTHISNNNSSLSFSSINLNKYKINTNSSQNNKNIIFNNNTNSNNNTYSNNNIYSNNNLNNLNNIKNTNMSLNMNFNNKNNNNNNSKKIYQDYFSDNPKYEKESRRMIIEYIKILNSNSNNVKQTIFDNNISLKVLNQKYNENENNNYANNQELFGEAKKQLYLKNLNYSLSYDSFRSNNNEEINTVKNNDILNIDNLNNILFIKDKKKINILNFLFVPRILNLIEEDENIPQKCIFLVTLDKVYYMEGKESYIFQWRDISSNEVENEFNLKEVKSCVVSKKYNNRFILEVEKEDSMENMNFEIETPNKEICNNYIMGINYLMK